MAVALLELFVVMFFFKQTLEPRNISKYFKLAVVAGVAIIHITRSFIPFSTYINFGITLILWSLLIIFLFNDSFAKKITVILIYFAAVIMCDSLSRLITAFILNIPYNTLGAIGIQRYIFNAINICLHFAILAVFSLFIKKRSLSLPIRYWIMLLMFPLFGLFIIICTDYLLILANVRNVKYIVLLIVIVVGLLYFNIAVFEFIDNYSAKLQLKTAEELIKMQEENYRLLEMNEKDLRALRHNISKHMSIMQNMLERNNISETQEFMHSLKSLSALPLGIVYTNDITLDSILNVGCKKATALNIQYIVKSNNITEPINISPADKSTILCNAIDNAIEATSKTDEKFIVIDISANKNNIKICIENSSLPIITRNNIIFTTKNDTKNHGFGINSIKRSLSKYNGNLDISYNSGIVKCTILLDNPQK